jgi:hypothetical protein
MSQNISALDLAWEEINALGGVAEKGNEREQGFVAAIGKGLAVIEKLGGSDPLPKRHATAES